MSTLLGLPDERRAQVERELTVAAREAVLGRLLVDVAHDVANSLFAMIGLADLVIADPGTSAPERLTMVRDTGLGLKSGLQGLMEFARAEPDGEPRADLVQMTVKAIGLVRHGRGKHVELVERYPGDAVLVACPAALLMQAVLHLLAGAVTAERTEVEVTADGVLRVAPALLEPLDLIAASRIAADYGGSFAEGSLTLPLVR